nr:P-loop NTPase fold protein [uncultured Blautia sp.]
MAKIKKDGEVVISKEDVLDREAFVKQIVDLAMVLSEKRKNCCFAIEGEWGSGKSFVLENIQECLQPEQSEETGADRFFVVRYDCWKYDYYEEPIVAIISVLRDQIDQYINLLTDDAKRVLLETVKNTITKIAVEAIKAKTGIDMDGVGEVPEGDVKIYDKYFGFQKVVKKVQNQIEKISQTQTVVIMVDELDRCLPLYAIKVLERIHHVFNEIENVVVIVAMEKKQISNSLHQIYGDEMDVDRYLKKIIAFSFKLDNGSAHNFIEKYASYMEMFDIKERDGLEEFLKEITANIDIRTQEKIFEKAENLHRLLATQEKMDSCILAFEIVTLCVKEKMSTVHLEWMINTSSYPNIEREIGKEYFDIMRKYVRNIIEFPSYMNNKLICNEDRFIDRMIFIIAGLTNEYKNRVCAEFFCADEEIENDLIFSRKIYELLKI